MHHGACDEILFPYCFFCGSGEGYMYIGNRKMNMHVEVFRFDWGVGEITVLGGDSQRWIIEIE